MPRQGTLLRLRKPDCWEKVKMKKLVDVNTGEVRVSRKRTILRSLAIGSCVVVAAYDSKNKVGALAHIMLPGRAPERTADKTKYAVDALHQMIARMAKAGAGRKNIEACLVGGGNVLKRKGDTTGSENIGSAARFLEERQIPVRGSVLGGTERKGVFLDVDTGHICYTEGDGEQKPLWKPRAKGLGGRGR